MYVDWEYYKIFYYVAKYQNFTKAARVLGNNQPNITHSMNRLESQLNCVLFIRSNRGVTLTPEGELLYSRIASAAVQIQDAEEELSATATLEHGAISISTTETALNIYLSEKLRAFHTEYPGIRLRISNHSTPQAVQAVRNGEVDFAIVTTPAEVENGLKMVELMPFYEVLVGGKTFTALASQTLNLKELAGYPLICLNEESMTRSFYRQFFLEHDAVLKPRRNVAAVEHHAFYDLAVRLSRLGFFNGDNAVGRDLFHRVGDEVADLLTCRGNSRNTCNVLRAGNLLGVLLNRLNSCLGRLLNALSQNHRVCACGNVLHALTDECLCKQRCGRGAVACNVVRLGCNFLHELCAHVLKRIFKLNFLSDCHAVVRNERCAELLIEHNVSALRAKGDLNGICKLVDTAEQCFSGFFAVNDLLCHSKLPHNSKYQK